MFNDVYSEAVYAGLVRDEFCWSHARAGLSTASTPYGVGIAIIPLATIREAQPIGINAVRRRAFAMSM